MNSHRSGYKSDWCRQNIVQNNLFQSNVYQRQSEYCTEHKDVSEPVDGQRNNPGRTKAVFTDTFIADFKEKRRRVLLHRLRNLRSKEKIGSCALMLVQLERLKRDVHRLSAPKASRGLEINTVHEETRSLNTTINDDVERTQGADNGVGRASRHDSVRKNSYPRKKHYELDSKRETTTRFSRPGDITVGGGGVGNTTINTGSGTDCNVMSMEISDNGEGSGSNNGLQRQLSSTERMHGRL